MKIAVTGAQGNLGHELVLQGCIPVVSDILSDDLQAELKQLRPEVVINCAAKNGPEKALQNPDLFRAVNTRGVSKILKAFTGRVIHISTDYVFDGEKGDYIEDDDPNPINYYGLTKWGGEIFANVLGDGRACVVRTSWLYGGYRKNDLVTTILKGIQDGGSPLLMGISYRSNPTYIPHLAEALKVLAGVEHLPPILHIAGVDTVSRYEFAKELIAVWNLPKFFLPSDYYLDNSPVKRPHNSSLRCTKAEDMRIPLYSLFRGLVDYNAVYSA